jgi:hypothetical protein
MLNYLLVWIVALGSVGLYLSRFFLPEMQRKNDWIWSGVGLFYALILLADSDRIRGGLLLGQMASVALIVGFCWQALQQRRQLAPSQTPIPDSVDGILPFVKTGWGRLLAAYKDGALLDAPATSGETDSQKQPFKIAGLTIPTDLSKIFSIGSSSEEPRPIVSSPQTPTSTASANEDWEEESALASESSPPEESTPELIAESSIEESIPVPPTMEAPTIDVTEIPESTESSTVEDITELVSEVVVDAITSEKPSASAENIVVHENTDEVSTIEKSEDHSNASETIIEETSAEKTGAETPDHKDSNTPAADTGEDWPPQDPVT